MAGKRTCGDETFFVDMRLLFVCFVCLFCLFVCFFWPQKLWVFVDEGNLFFGLLRTNLRFFEVPCPAVLEGVRSIFFIFSFLGMNG